jgi:hypothetical protein
MRDIGAPLRRARVFIESRNPPAGGGRKLDSALPRTYFPASS